jgi:hypothetical protein
MASALWGPVVLFHWLNGETGHDHGSRDLRPAAPGPDKDLSSVSSTDDPTGVPMPGLAGPRLPNG